MTKQTAWAVISPEGEILKFSIGETYTEAWYKYQDAIREELNEHVDFDSFTSEGYTVEEITLIRSE